MDIFSIFRRKKGFYQELDDVIALATKIAREEKSEEQLILHSTTLVSQLTDLGQKMRSIGSAQLKMENAKRELSKGKESSPNMDSEELQKREASRIVASRKFEELESSFESELKLSQYGDRLQKQFDKIMEKIERLQGKRRKDEIQEQERLEATISELSLAHHGN
jgi:hypothetical protein|tara:strand:- start:162 stop:656 length:495 start_codon:yes stop_codon:yes gene_type:complete